MNKMNRICTLFTIALLIVMTMTVNVTEAARKRIAVMPFKSTGYYTKTAETMTEMLTSTLTSSNEFTVVERTQIASTIKEINFQNSGMVKPGDETEYGNFTGTDYTIIGNVLNTCIVENTTAKIGNLFSSVIPYRLNETVPKIKGKVSVNIRIINNHNGEVIYASPTITTSKAGNNNEMALYQACETATNKLTDILTKAIHKQDRKEK